MNKIWGIMLFLGGLACAITATAAEPGYARPEYAKRAKMAQLERGTQKQFRVDPKTVDRKIASEKPVVHLEPRRGQDPRGADSFFSRQ